MHEHNHCKHSLEYCEICDTAYCKKCGKEWRNNIFYYRSTPYWWTYTYNNEGVPAQDYTITNGCTHNT